ncbi:MAG TPA: NADH-quinone oxidoreductase subunit L [Chitinophagaceae bacterium]|nr:NADH-quinone oxidoreductase subunit L [Chitinophagaceae bacterium]
MNDVTSIALIPLLPLAGFLLLGLLGRSVSGRVAGVLATLLMAGASALALVVAWHYFFRDQAAGNAYLPQVIWQASWLPFSGGLGINVGILADPISVMMLVVVTFVSLMVHVFSLGYMHGEERLPAYYAFLGLFTFSMLGLVLSPNLLQTYIFWELVGLSSYLLIGFYFQRPAAVAAAKKAFIVTRFADLGFLVGILILAFCGNSLDIGTLLDRLTNTQAPQYAAATTASFAGITALTWGLTLVFVGGAGKSAMFPLHIWLPDAMEGPTPVSALIHAATMVVAGVYLVARLFPLYSINNASLLVVTAVGSFSALLAALIACTQTDIKRILAYSTMSQIGYMLFSLGVARYGGEQAAGFTASLFHLFTHAFFKSLLFLCAGAIIHRVHSNEVKDMGGLRRRMPVTHLCFLVACLAISGIPPFAGFFSKEQILHAAYADHKLVYATGLITSGLTAFYMFRLYFLIFWNQPSRQEDGHREGTLSMLVPLGILAACSLLAGLIPFGRFVSADGRPASGSSDWTFALAPVLLAAAAILVAERMYRRPSPWPQRLAERLGGLYRAARRKFYMDELYLFITKRIIFPWIGRPAAWIDRNVVDGLMNGIAAATQRISYWIRAMQSGRVQQYALFFFGGVLALAWVLIYVWQN